MVDSGAAENVMPKSAVPEMSTEGTERQMHGKGFKGLGGEDIKNYRQQVMSVRTLEGICTQEHVAGCLCEKTPCVCITRHPSRNRPVHREG